MEFRRKVIIQTWRFQGEIRRGDRHQQHRNPALPGLAKHGPQVVGDLQVILTGKQVVTSMAKDQKGRVLPIQKFRKPLNASSRKLTRHPGIDHPASGKA
jgi:hypothetical protein